MDIINRFSDNPYSRSFHLALLHRAFHLFLLAFLSLNYYPVIKREIYQPEQVTVPAPTESILTPQPSSEDFEERVYEWKFPVEILEDGLSTREGTIKILINKKELEKKRARNPNRKRRLDIDV